MVNAAQPLTSVQERALQALRGDPENRPVFGQLLSETLEHEIEEALQPIFDAFPKTELRIRKHELTWVHQCEGRYAASLADDTFSWSLPAAQGKLVHRAIELWVGERATSAPARLVDMAIDSMHASAADSSLSEHLRAADATTLADLRNGTVDHVVKFWELLPRLPDAWSARAESTTAASLCHNKLVLYGRIDLKLGMGNGTQAGAVIIDFKTGTPARHDLHDLRYYALIETIRTGVPPLRWANVYLDTGRIETEDAGQDVLWSATRRVIDGARKLHEIQQGKPPLLSPGVGCRFCAARTTCEAVITQDDEGDIQDDDTDEDG